MVDNALLEDYGVPKVEALLGQSAKIQVHVCVDCFWNQRQV